MFDSREIVKETKRKIGIIHKNVWMPRKLSSIWKPKKNIGKI
jgi:hypothetical protein